MAKLTDIQRIKKIINWLIFNGIAENETGIAQRLGYTASSFSQIVNGKVPLANKFIRNLCNLDKQINETWVKTGEGEMLHTQNNMGEQNNVNGDNINGNNVTVNNQKETDKLLNLLMCKEKSLAKAQEHIDKLLDVVKTLSK